jgi:pentatricopeptide repeat protein
VCRVRDNAIDHYRCRYSFSISHNPYFTLDWSLSYTSRSNDHVIVGSEQHPTQVVLPIALNILTLVETGRLDDAIQELRGCNNGTEIPSSIYHAVIEACCAGGFDPNNNNKRQPKKFKNSINKTDDNVDRIEIASELLHSMKEQYKVTGHAYEIIISGYARRGRWEDAYRTLSEMEETYKDASNQHDNAEQRNNPDELPTKGNHISLNFYQTVLTSMAKSNQYHHVNSLLTKMRRQGVRPNVYTYNALLKICASDDATPRWKEGLSFLSQCQREPGVTPDLITYTTAMKVCARGKQADKAMELFRAVKDMGELELDVYFYTTAMDACAKGGKWRRALSLLDEMKEERGILPNVVTYGVAIAACGNGGQWKKALELLDQMRGDNLSINTITYNSAIAALSKAARTESKMKPSSVSDASDDVDALWQKALHLIQCMEKEGVKRDSFTYSSAISACGAAGRWEEALHLIQSMKREGGTRPNRVAYTSAITACANSRYARNKSFASFCLLRSFRH